jgi:hypothetical protein
MNDSRHIQVIAEYLKRGREFEKLDRATLKLRFIGAAEVLLHDPTPEAMCLFADFLAEYFSRGILPSPEPFERGRARITELRGQVASAELEELQKFLQLPRKDYEH